MTQVQWADPPPIGGPQDPRSAWMERLRQLVERPGQWAKVASGTPYAMHSAAGALRTRQRHVPPGAWEFAVRTFRRGEHIGDLNVAMLYARFLGDDPALQSHDDFWAYQAAQAPRNEDGLRICQDCGDPLPQTGHKWPIRCASCWRALDTKWARKRYGSEERV